jgi:hypothetical protein
MPRGRPAAPKSATKFLNSKRRVIYMTANGKYIAKSDKGATVYAPKARFVKSPGGTERSISNSNTRIPTAIRPKAVRKVRSNKGGARGAYSGVKAGALPALFSPKAKRAVGRPRKYKVSPGGNMGLAALFGGKAVRKTRANAGMKRGARVPKKTLNKNPYAALM